MDSVEKKLLEMEERCKRDGRELKRVSIGRLSLKGQELGTTERKKAAEKLMKDLRSPLPSTSTGNIFLL